MFYRFHIRDHMLRLEILESLAEMSIVQIGACFDSLRPYSFRAGLIDKTVDQFLLE